jgi:flavin reductase (DIM6/NTAB) family NADH-FMN oxidoreductase RutF
MFYDATLNDHGLPHDPFKAIVAPRPVGWISAMSAKGEVNLSPYSFFNALSTRPPLIMFSSEGFKDAVAFVSETKEFVCSLASYPLREAMNATSAPLPRGQSEFEFAGLASAPSRMVRPPRVAAAPAALECQLISLQQLTDLDGRKLDRWLAIGQVVGVYIDDRFVVGGRFDTAAAQPIARCGYHDYAVISELFSMTRPPGG